MAEWGVGGHDEPVAPIDEFERLGRAAGAELRMAAPPGGDAAVARSVRRHRVRVVAGATVLLVAAGVGLTIVTRHDDGGLDPVTDSPATVAPTTTDPVDLEIVRAGEPWIVYQGPSERGDRVFVVRPDGTGGHQLVPDQTGGSQSKPFWSPDGERVAFTAAISAGEELWTVGADGSDPEVLAECTSDCIYLDDPSWSPDGRSIVYARMTRSGEAAAGSLERVDVTTGDVEVLLAADRLDFFAGPRWSPDGQSIVVEVVHRAADTYDSEVTGVTLTVVELQPGEPRVRSLTDRGSFAVTPDWSPRGDLIVFAAPSSPGAPTTDLFVMSPDGGVTNRLTFLGEEARSASFPSFDAGGDRVIFTASQPTGGEVIALVDVDVDGQAVVPIEMSVAGSHARLRPTASIG